MSAGKRCDNKTERFFKFSDFSNSFLRVVPAKMRTLRAKTKQMTKTM